MEAITFAIFMGLTDWRGEGTLIARMAAKKNYKKLQKTTKNIHHAGVVEFNLIPTWH